MKKKSNNKNTPKKLSNLNIFNIFTRYLLILLLGLSNLFVFYKLFTPATAYLSYFFLSLFGNSYLFGSIIFFKSNIIELIPACIAGSAYYLLFILAFSIADIKLVKRITILVFSFALFLLVNVFRITFLAIIANAKYFSEIHLFFWYFLSTVFLVLIWLLCIKVFKIKTIPIYSDIKYIYSLSKKKK